MFATLSSKRLSIISVNSIFAGQDAAESKIAFTVQWYDVGKDALDGLQGVNKVDKGMHGFREINTVYYDPELITIEEMETALKEAGTYVGIEK